MLILRVVRARALPRGVHHGDGDAVLEALQSADLARGGDHTHIPVENKVKLARDARVHADVMETCAPALFGKFNASDTLASRILSHLSLPCVSAKGT